jgi:hypothetical protein
LHNAGARDQSAGEIMPHMHEYRAVFKCCNCHWDNDQTIEENDAAKPPEKHVDVDCWHCGSSNDVVVKLSESN